MGSNPYQGINAHLNSFLQSDGGGWEMFHSSFIEKLVDDLDIRLPQNYYVLNQKSLQVSISDPYTESPLRHRTAPDVAIAKRNTPSAVTEMPGSVSAPTLTLPLTATLEDDPEYASAALIYHMEMGKYPGNLVTRIELLSPGNKPGGGHYRNYLVKRRETLESGVCLIEIDWLHETRSITHTIPSYPDGQPGAFAYTIIVNDPRPSLYQGRTDIYGTRVDEVLPVIAIPLAAADRIMVDFGPLYRRTIDRRAYGIVVDYTKDPERMETYSAADQVRIRARMAAIAAEKGSES